MQQKSLISGLKASSSTIDECKSHVEANLGDLIKTKVENELCKTNCETEIDVKCEENDSTRRRRAAKKIFDVTLEIIIQQESEPEIISIKDENETEEAPAGSLMSLIDTETILKATMKILEEIEASDKNDDFVKIETSGQVLVSSEPIEEISSELDPRLVYQEIESDNEVTTGANKNVTDVGEEASGTDDDNDDGNDSKDGDNSQSVDESLLFQLQTENKNLKIKLDLVEDNFDEIKSNYDSIK